MLGMSSYSNTHHIDERYEDGRSTTGGGSYISSSTIPYPLMENKQHQVHKQAEQEQQLRNEFTVDIHGPIEESVKEQMHEEVRIESLMQKKHY